MQKIQANIFCKENTKKLLDMRSSNLVPLTRIDFESFDSHLINLSNGIYALGMTHMLCFTKTVSKVNSIINSLVTLEEAA
ncbi:hypothetical protein M9Y_00245 [Rickettsia prowazekii str. Katsinyian]|nr:hypothetical protein M9Y_00245 [Rickettsia prowazekii str. Katsinyian]AGJ01392.1 ADP,ATP carrier protein 1 [Rickettsia prowazekii str. NMRC Madrid E]AGJ02803.1 hypothetical protein H375_5790 [Rickettsia prowazekii str. Breinl]AMS12762.1 hypothetical protein AR462_00255 [Rickettsia prowazekii]EOB09512.1 hypothetical protein H377_8150 [Rickettsia prowazekii str. Cairo 3]EOB10125.1 hypothetical protein H376_2740 [Rickettsia prowazekii str. GvF12]